MPVNNLARNSIGSADREIEGTHSDAIMKTRIIDRVETRFGSAHRSCSRPHRAGAALVLLLIAALAVRAHAGSPADRAPRTAVVVFADRPLQQEQWSALLAALRAALASNQAETGLLDQNAEFLRGDELVPGLTFESAITVFLHGDCTLAPLLHRSAFGVPLGWVRRSAGRIEPFVHVDCSSIGNVLGPQAMWLSKDRRADVMAHAIARVILHEWIHIATQSTAHAEHGVEKASFGVADLMGGFRVTSWPNSSQ
jgi:hypothetical protein